ncbi:IS256 family transposase [Pseudovibrio sp. Tun.PSC04-5.I4]|uniref:IS256 family transposase n=1 Tax=Pseudovibrio sp. Tun.PSC04-5.I4 TaxID=1798213 RepID=UPI00087E0188|nr:IS256 family transposase [Pseudovibrio sp. Tun.PSC04-5.I4]SDR44939.1 Transposase (or an inactivated derivative) [Pseudovibrio sp. Tun.PSC04-5.I4]
MTDDSVIPLVQPGEFQDALTEVLRSGAQQLLRAAIESEVVSVLSLYSDLKLPDGRQRVVRHGHLPERQVQTGVGPVTVSKPRIRDRDENAEEKIHYHSNLLPNYLRRSTSLDELIPALYLRGVSTNDVQQALSALLGVDAPNLSPDVIRGLVKSWRSLWEEWKTRDLSARNYVYMWADGIYLKARGERESRCILVLIGATPEGKKELIGFDDGYREDTQSWRELLLALKARGLQIEPKLAVGDGALGFWAALREVFGTTKAQRCWVHKTMNVLSKMPKSLQAKAKKDLQDIWMAENRVDAEAAFDLFIEKFEAKYPKATQCLAKDRIELLAFYDFPAEHWGHIRTTNPIESTFATVRHRTRQTKNCLSRDTAMPMVFMLIKAAEKRWQKLRGKNQLPKIIQGVIFTNGIESDANQNHAA